MALFYQNASKRWHLQQNASIRVQMVFHDYMGVQELTRFATTESANAFSVQLINGSNQIRTVHQVQMRLKPFEMRL